MLLDVLRFTGGFVLLLVGADVLVRGGSALALRMGMSRLMVGLTVVAMGTSMPELIVSATAAFQGAGDVALGNVVGSNIMNILVVLGVTALVYPIAVQRQVIRQDIPLVAGISMLAWSFMVDGTLSRMEGFLLLAITVPYLRHLYIRERSVAVSLMQVPVPSSATVLAIVGVVAGMGMLAFGGRFVVEGGTAIATAVGVPQRVMALTLVAFGTSAPELATSLVAAWRKQVDLAVGNVVGSNLLNLLFVLGTSAMVRDIPVARQIITFDGPVMIVCALVLLQFASNRGHIQRWEGAALLGLYGTYVALLFF